MYDASTEAVTEESRTPHEPRIRWLFAALLVFSSFVIGLMGFGLAGFGPCAASNPIALFFSGALSALAVWGSILVLTHRQRKLRLRTIPFYLALIVGGPVHRLCSFYCWPIHKHTVSVTPREREVYSRRN